MEDMYGGIGKRDTAAFARQSSGFDSLYFHWQLEKEYNGLVRYWHRSKTTCS